MDAKGLREYINKQTYDKLYQDVECVELKGYSVSVTSWENIKGLVDWKDKFVVDCGCFHGYFSFKVEKEGAKRVLGLDKYKEVVTTVNLIKDFSGSKATFVEWTSGDPVPECDIILCMNVLHHFPNREDFLRSANCKQAIFEVNKVDVEVIKKYFDVVKEVGSHRENRVILLCNRKVVKVSSSNLQQHEETKIFVTGTYGSGKTWYAKEYAYLFGLKYIDFDMYFNYAKSVDSHLQGDPEKNIVNILSDKYVIDAIPYSLKAPDFTLTPFNFYAEQNNIRVVCCFCSSKQMWKERLLTKKGITVMEFVRWQHYADFYYKTLLNYKKFKISYFDTTTNEYVTEEEMYKRISWVKGILEFTP